MRREIEVIDFEKWVTRKRKEKKYHQYELAEMIPCNERTLRNYINGKKSVPLDIAERIVNILGAELVIKEKEE